MVGTTARMSAAAGIAIYVILFQVCNVASSTCPACPENLMCRSVPANCEAIHQFCQCCPVCARKVDEACGDRNCESGLMCVDEDNRAMPVVRWDHIGFRGKCKKIEMCHVIGDGRWSPSSRSYPPAPAILVETQYV